MVSCFVSTFESTCIEKVMITSGLGGTYVSSISGETSSVYCLSTINSSPTWYTYTSEPAPHKHTYKTDYFLDPMRQYHFLILNIEGIILKQILI
jgi:hypothetical protein